MTEINPGALPDKPDERDFKVGFIAGAPVVDWSTPFSLLEPPDEDQGSSDSCVSHGSSYLHWQLRPEQWSRRDLFARIAQDYGAYIRDGVMQIVNNGQQTKDEAPDPVNQTAKNMRDGRDWNPEKAKDGKEFDAFSLNDWSIDGLAWGIKNYKGVIFGVTGSAKGWANQLNPRPPLPGESTWGHCIYGKGYHMHDGQKCIIAKSSYCKSGIKEHHIKENYFKSGNTFSPWVLIPKENNMDEGYFYSKDQRTLVYFKKISSPVVAVGLSAVTKAPVPHTISSDGSSVHVDFDALKRQVVSKDSI